MMWSMPVCLLLVLGIHFSTQDMVTLAPSEGEAEVSELDSTTPKLKVKPIIRSLHITSDIKYRYATTLVSSRVVNPSDQAGEAVFYVTLPESAFISEFLMCVSVLGYNSVYVIIENSLTYAMRPAPIEDSRSASAVQMFPDGAALPLYTQSLSVIQLLVVYC
ncbi:hyaluronan metabolic process [Homalodisca vitripennis]|nr:hyaluronan metabolic process [Homalodisca vitripennis]